MKAKSRGKSKRDNETPEKCLSDDGKGNFLDSDITNNKSNDLYSELKITEENLQKFFKEKCSTPSENVKSSVVVRHTIPIENQRLPTRRICVLKKAPPNVPAIPSSSLLDQNSLRFDTFNRPVQHSILGTVDEYFKMSLDKKKLSLEEIPSEYHHILGYGTQRRPFSAMFPVNMTEKEKENIVYRKVKRVSSVKYETDFDTNALKLWEQRMKERKKLQNHISKKINRTPDKLIFNSAEGFREIVEKQYLISKSIPFHGYGYGFRTGSEFWQQNEVVGIDPIDCLHMTNTQTEKGYPPPILHIGVTNKIKEEKGVPVHNLLDKKKIGVYQQERFRELIDIIYELDPHEPEFTDLVVVGNPLKGQVGINDNNSIFSELHGEMKNESFTSQNLSRSETIQGSERTNQLYTGPCLFINSLKLEGRLIENSSDSRIEIRMLFNGHAKDRCLENLTFQNRGTSIIRYWWKKLDSYDPFNLENKNTRRFYFNTEDGILLPNQDLKFPIIFKSEKSGLFTEMWKIETMPLLADGKDILIILKGVALQRDTLATVRKDIDIYLKYQVADKICRNILDEIIQDIDGKHFQLTFNEFDENTEKEIFHKKNKGVYYEIDNIHSLKKLNDEIGTKETQFYNDWNLDCGKLRTNIVSAKSIKTVKKEEICEKFYKYMDKAMIPITKAAVIQRDQLYRIGYRILLDFFGQMFDGLSEIRKYHDLPEIEIKMANDKRRGTISRQKTNVSQMSKKQTSANTIKSKSKEPSNLIRESTENFMTESDEGDKVGMQNFSETDEGITNENEQFSQLHSNLVAVKYHFKSHQMAYSLLDKAIDNIIAYWEEITFGEL